MPEIEQDIFAAPSLFGDDADYVADLFDEFIMPPFSVLDRRGGKWQTRKKQWLALGIQSELGRDTGLAFGNPDSDSFVIQQMQNINQGTSVFDPLLTECILRWFSAIGCQTLDPFAGGSVRGIVASTLKRHYTGIDLRKEQIEANKTQLHLGHATYPPTWICGDSANIQELTNYNNYDLIFSCPPYFDLEIYSENKADLSNMEWAEFCEMYGEIIKETVGLLNNDRFAVFVVGEVRDSKGYLRGLVPETIKAFTNAGMQFYNNAIVLDPVGTARLRAGKQFRANRKLVTVHQHLLVFVKGDSTKAAAWTKYHEGLDYLDDCEFEQ
jgi:16S rRNA G966 N2-methylase RsmD